MLHLRLTRLGEQEGFVTEGTLRDCNRAGDRPQSLVVMSILGREHRAR